MFESEVCRRRVTEGFIYPRTPAQSRYVLTALMVVTVVMVVTVIYFSYRAGVNRFNIPSQRGARTSLATFTMCWHVSTTATTTDELTYNLNYVLVAPNLHVAKHGCLVVIPRDT